MKTALKLLAVAGLGYVGVGTLAWYRYGSYEGWDPSDVPTLGYVLTHPSGPVGFRNAFRKYPRRITMDRQTGRPIYADTGEPVPRGAFGSQMRAPIVGHDPQGKPIYGWNRR